MNTLKTEPHKRYLVTGGTGFMGRMLVERLLESGHEVSVLARSVDEDLVKMGAQWHQGSILDEPLVEEVSSPMDGIFHLAGLVEHTRKKGFERFREVHVKGTLIVLAAAMKASAKVVYASTCGTVACSKGPVAFGEDASYKKELVRQWPYYITKIEAEEAALTYAQENNVDLVTMRPALLLGPGDTRLSSSRTVLDFIERKIPFTPGGGMNIVDVRDVAEVFMAAMERGKAGQTYLIGATNLTIEDFFAKLAKLSGVAAPRLKVPYALAHAGARAGSRLLGIFGKSDPGLDPAVVEMASHFWYLDDSAARSDLGWDPRPLEETLEESIKWVSAHRDTLRAL